MSPTPSGWSAKAVCPTGPTPCSRRSRASGTRSWTSSGAVDAVAQARMVAVGRGIHPPVLDQGLGIALTTLAVRSDLPVELVVDLPERPSAAIGPTPTSALPTCSLT